jgi:hypothetical protein
MCTSGGTRIKDLSWGQGSCSKCKKNRKKNMNRDHRWVNFNFAQFISFKPWFLSVCCTFESLGLGAGWSSTEEDSSKL